MDGAPEQQGGGHGLGARVATAILESAAAVVARRGDGASMADVAAAAGVARATVYRHFPSRRALLDELQRRAAADVGARLRAARILEVPAHEAVARAVRALVEAGDNTMLLVAARLGDEPEGFERDVMAILGAAFERAQDEGRIRADVPASWLAESVLGLVGSAFRASPGMGREDMVGTVTSLVLDGAGAAGGGP